MEILVTYDIRNLQTFSLRSFFKLFIQYTLQYIKDISKFFAIHSLIWKNAALINYVVLTTSHVQQPLHTLKQKRETLIEVLNPLTFPVIVIHIKLKMYYLYLILCFSYNLQWKINISFLNTIFFLQLHLHDHKELFVWHMWYDTF